LLDPPQKGYRSQVMAVCDLTYPTSQVPDVIGPHFPMTARVYFELDPTFEPGQFWLRQGVAFDFDEPWWNGMARREAGAWVATMFEAIESEDVGVFDKVSNLDSLDKLIQMICLTTRNFLYNHGLQPWVKRAVF
jgi:hypothetical protein